MTERSRRLRSRRWPLVLIGLLVVAGGLWSAAWSYGAGVAERTIAGWRTREARAGRIYTCTDQTISGFPFGIDVHCLGAGAEFKSNHPPLALTVGDMRVSAQVWRPTMLTTQFAAPLNVAEPGRPTMASARWRHAEVRLRSLPSAPESATIQVDRPVVTRTEGGELFKADSLDVNGSLVSGSVELNPVIQIELKLGAATAPLWHPAANVPVDAAITTVLRGLKDFSPKPWPQRFRELQATGGRIKIVKARLQQGDTVAIANGVLGLSPYGRLDGELNLTIANLEQFLSRLGLDRMLAPDRAPQLNETFSRLDRLLPGLGTMARQNAAPMITAGVGLMGQPTELEGRRAVALPLRFEDGVVSLGPLKIGVVPPLY